MKTRREPKDFLAFALDLPTAEAARPYVQQLKDHVGYFKIGLELFIAAGPGFVEEVAEENRVFLDLKLHDIPATVGRASAAAKNLGASLLTVHGSGGEDAAKAASAGFGDGVLLVTVLTSVAAGENVGALVESRAAMAEATGCTGIVCSGHETRRIRDAMGESLFIVNPGIRPTGSAVGDQKRVVTPKQAVDDGASLLVVGRPIRDAADPVEAAAAILREIAG
jgi:orotidine-5'-phosphate decarboxylase